jgi:MFS family permease
MARPSAPRLLLINGLIRVASAATGQLFAFLLADRMGAASHAGRGSLLVGLIGVSFYITELLGAPAAGRIADVRGQLVVLRWGPAFGIASVLIGAAAAVVQVPVMTLGVVLVAARVSEGASAACAVPTTLALLAQTTEGRASRRLRLMGLFEITSLVGLIVGYLVAGVAWDALSWAAFLLLPPSYGAAWLLAHSVDSTETRTSVRDVGILRAVKELLGSPGAVPFIVAWLAVNVVVGVWLQQAPYLLKLPTRMPSQSLVGGFSGREIGVVFAVWGFTFLTGIAMWSLLAARWPRRRTLTVGLIGMLVVVASLAAVNHGASRVILAVAVIGVLLESGFTPAAFAHLADLTDSRETQRGATMGVYSLLLGVGQLAGAALGGPLAARWQMDGVLACTAILAAVSLIGIARMTPALAPTLSRDAREPTNHAASP